MGLRKLGTKRKEAEAQAAAEAQQDEKPAGWGKATAPSEDEQRERISSKLQGEDSGEAEAPVDAKGAFSQKTQATMAGEKDSDQTAEEKPKTTRKHTSTKKAAAPVLERSLRVGLSLTPEGDPIPHVEATMNGDFDEDMAVRLTELVIASMERVIDELEGGDD